MNNQRAKGTIRLWGTATVQVCPRFVSFAHRSLHSVREEDKTGKDGVHLDSCRGFTLFELLVAMLLLAMISVMIYSALHVSIKFTAKGEKKILAMEHKYGLLNLLKSQISSAVYDVKKRELMIWADDNSFKLVTRNPYIYEEAGVVLAIYIYNSSERAIYYTEKRDYYNTDYDEEYLPDIDDMTLLAADEDSFAVQYDKDMGPTVTFTYRDKEYTLVPECADDAALKKLLEPEE